MQPWQYALLYFLPLVEEAVLEDLQLLLALNQSYLRAFLKAMHPPIRVHILDLFPFH